MANRTYYPKRSYGTARVDCEFTFTAPGAGTSVTVATAVDGADVVASITHVGGSNLLTVTLKDSFNKVINASANVIQTNGARATIGGITNEGGTTSGLSFGIYTWVAAGTALNDCADRITVSLSLRNGNWGTK